jgi:hypothetical protein
MTVPQLSQYLQSLTTFRFVAEVVERDGEYVDIGDAVYTQWILRDDSNTRIAAIAINAMNNKWAQKIQVGKRYTFCNGVLVQEAGCGINLDDLRLPIFFVFTPQTNVLVESSAQRTPLNVLVADALKVEFRATVRNITNIDADWDPGEPQFCAILADTKESQPLLKVCARGPGVCTAVRPMLDIGKTFVFTGGEIGMEYSAKSLFVRWIDTTTVSEA